MSTKTDNSKSKVDPAVDATPHGMSTKNKLLLAAGAAIVAVAATEIALRKYTKTGGIVPNLRRLGKKGKKYLAKKDGVIATVKRTAKKGKKVLAKKLAAK